MGLIQLARVVDVFARRLQAQERLPYNILESIHNTLKPKGVAVVIEVQYNFVMMRGM